MATQTKKATDGTERGDADGQEGVAPVERGVRQLGEALPPSGLASTHSVNFS